MSFEWYTHLCDYHNVTPEEALKLGTRRTGRRPDLPGSDTCKKVSNMNYEEIWASSDRKTIEGVFDFYRDQGAWSTFRQCVRHRDMENLHMTYFDFLSKNNFLKNDVHICEYGCGVAPFCTSLLKYSEIPDGVTINLTLVDVDCDHLDFAEYRLNRIKKDLKLEGKVNLNFIRVKPNVLPDFSNKHLDILFCFEVLEHVPSPVNVVNNIKDNMVDGGIYIENFIKHDADDDDEEGPDLKSARQERSSYYEIVNANYNLLIPSEAESVANPSCTRIWQRKTM